MNDPDTKKHQQDHAELLLAQGRFAEAISLLESLHEAYPDEASIEMMLSMAYYDGGNVENAVKHLERLLVRELQRNVFTGFAFDELVRIYKRQKNYGRLVSMCEDAVSAKPEDTGLLAELGKAYCLSGDFSRACSVYEKLIDLEGDNPAFYCDWGEALFGAGFIEESEKAFNRAGEIDSENSDDYYFKMAVLFQDAGRHSDAIRLLQRCILLDETNPLYYCAMGDSFIFLGEIQNALASYNRAVEHDPDRAGAYYNRLGNAFLQNKNFKEAARAFQNAVQAEPLQIYFLNLAAAYEAMGFTRQAEAILKKWGKAR